MISMNVTCMEAMFFPITPKIGYKLDRTIGRVSALVEYKQGWETMLAFCGVRSGFYKSWIQPALLIVLYIYLVMHKKGSISPKLAHKNSSECFQKVIELIKIRHGQSTSHPRVGLPALDGEQEI